MFNKIKEKQYDDVLVKYYNSSEKIDYLQLIITLAKKDKSQIDIYEDEDVGLKTVASEYNLERFLKNYTKIKSSDISEICLDTEYYNMPIIVKIYPKTNEINNNLSKISK